MFLLPAQWSENSETLYGYNKRTGGARGERSLKRIEKGLFLRDQFGVKALGMLNGSRLAITTPSWGMSDFSDSGSMEGLITEKP